MDATVQYWKKWTRRSMNARGIPRGKLSVRSAMKCSTEVSAETPLTKEDTTMGHPVRIATERSGPSSRPWTCTIAIVLIAIGSPCPVSHADDYERAPINYESATPANSRSADYRQTFRKGTTELVSDPQTGYLKSLLQRLDVPVSSQTLVFSKTSLQRNRISPPFSASSLFQR